jgi:fluoride exporter
MNEIKWSTLGILAGGGAIGTVCRYLIGHFFQQRHASDSIPWGTLSVNLIGSFLIGCLGALWIKFPIAYEWRLFLITGFLGGFTTFSAFALESYQLYQTKPFLMLLYITSSVLGGLSLCAIGFWLGSKAS